MPHHLCTNTYRKNSCVVQYILTEAETKTYSALHIYLTYKKNNDFLVVMSLKFQFNTTC